MRRDEKLLNRAGARKSKYKKPFIIWIGYVVITQIIASLLMQNSIVIPAVIESIWTLTVFIPPAVVLFRVFRNKNVKMLYRALAGFYCLVTCIAIIAAIILPLFGV